MKVGIIGAATVGTTPHHSIVHFSHPSARKPTGGKAPKPVVPTRDEQMAGIRERVAAVERPRMGDSCRIRASPKPGFLMSSSVCCPEPPGKALSLLITVLDCFVPKRWPWDGFRE